VLEEKAPLRRNGDAEMYPAISSDAVVSMARHQNETNEPDVWMRSTSRWSRYLDASFSQTQSQRARSDAGEG